MELEELSQRVGALQERQELAEALQRQGGQWSAVQAELERFRKLFEFVEGVLPKDAAKAMRFFTEESSARGEEGQPRDQRKGPSLSHMPPEFEYNQHRERLQEQVDGHAADMRREFENLTTAIKGLQRDFEHARDKISDLTGRVSGMESEARVQRRSGSTGSSVPSLHASGELRLGSPGASEMLERSPSAGAVAGRSSPSSTGTKSPFGGKVAGGEPRTKPDLAHLLEGENSQMPVPFVSPKVLASALEDLRQDVRNWLDVMHTSMLSALQQKADQENIKDIMEKVAQATAVANDGIALFAKRSITGKCASCDTPFSVDPATLKKTPPVSLERPWPPRGSPGAQVAIRPPQDIRQVEGKAYSSLKDGHRLPKIMDKSQPSRDFPRGKVLRNVSQPELRSLRSEVHTPD